MRVLDFIRENQQVAGWLFVASLGVMLVSLLLIPLIVAGMRSDYFVSRKPTEESWTGRHRVARWIWIAGKNVLGLGLVLAGLAMLVLPGQGLITVLIGVSLLNFPGKRRLELGIVRRGPVRRAVDWIRERTARPPLIIPEHDDD